MTIAQNTVAKLSVAFVTVAMLFSLVAPAQAQTVEELQAQIAALMAQIGSLSTTPAATTGSCVTPVAPLTMGAQGAEVTALQNFLISNGQAIAAGATGYFGGQTQAALASWQAANGVTPAAGYYGPITKAAMDAKCVPMTDGGDDTDTDTDEDTDSAELGNDEGSIAGVESISADESSLEEGTEGGVLAVEVEIEGDVEINRVDVFAEVDDSTTASDNADDYFSRAVLMVDGEEVAELDVDEFDTDSYNVIDAAEDGTTADEEYRLRFSGLGLVFADGDMPEFQVAFEVNSSLDSADLAADWIVEMDSIRFVDGEGFSDSEDTIDLNESFDFDEEEMGELSISEATDNPKDSTIEVDDEDESAEKTVFMFEIEEENGVDVTVEDMTLTLEVGNGATDESAVVDTAVLYNGTTEIGSESVPASGVVAFEGLSLDIEAKETAELTLKLVFSGTEDYAEGVTVVASFTSIDEAEDENGNDEGDMTISGSASSDTHTLRSAGIAVSVEEATTVITTEDGATNDTATFTWELDITAFGTDDVYVNKDFADIVTASAALDADMIFAIEVSAGAALTAVSGTVTSDADDVAADATAYSAAYSGEEFYIIEGGSTETFTITVVGTNQTDAKQVQAALSAIEWTVDDITAATAEDGSTAAINSYSDNLADDSETGFKSIN